MLVVCFRYLLLLNVRYVSEMLLESEDYRWLASALMGIVMGAKAGTFTSDDMEAVKYYMGNEGRGGKPYGGAYVLNHRAVAIYSNLMPLKNYFCHHK